MRSNNSLLPFAFAMLATSAAWAQTPLPACVTQEEKTYQCAYEQFYAYELRRRNRVPGLTLTQVQQSVKATCDCSGTICGTAQIDANRRPRLYPACKL